jgi:hypothetical protein
MRMSQRILVGRRNGKRVINWPVVVSLALLVGAVAGGSGAATWFLLTKEWSTFALLFPLFLSIGWFVGTAIPSGFSVPIEQLPSLSRRGNNGEHG